MFDDQVSSKVQEDRRRLMGDAGASSWGDNDEVANYSVDQLKADQQRMLGGNLITVVFVTSSKIFVNFRARPGA